jgi:hypothetical protein
MGALRHAPVSLWSSKRTPKTCWYLLGPLRLDEPLLVGRRFFFVSFIFYEGNIWNNISERERDWAVGACHWGAKLKQWGCIAFMVLISESFFKLLFCSWLTVLLYYQQVPQVMHQVKMFPFTREKSVEGPRILEFLFKEPFDLQFFNRLSLSHLSQTRHRFMIFILLCTWPAYDVVHCIKNILILCKYFFKRKKFKIMIIDLRSKNIKKQWKKS